MMGLNSAAEDRLKRVSVSSEPKPVGSVPFMPPCTPTQEERGFRVTSTA